MKKKKEITRMELIHNLVKFLRMEIELMNEYKEDCAVCSSAKATCYGAISYMSMFGYISVDYQKYLEYIVYSVYVHCVYGK